MAEVFIPYTIFTILGSISNVLLIFTPTVVVEIILKDFCADCEKSLNNSCQKLFEKYENLEKALGNFFLSLFSYTQFTVVFMTFIRKGLIVTRMHVNLLNLIYYFLIILIFYYVIIMNPSLSISSFFDEDVGVGVPKLHLFSYNMLLVCIHISNLTVLTRHIDKAYQSLQIMKKRILQDYQLTSDDYNRQNSFFLLKRVEMLSPMSGDG